MSLFKEITTLADKIDYEILLEPEEGEWCLYGGDALYWVNDNEVYSGEIIEGSSMEGDCRLINIDNGSGVTITKVFKESNELFQEAFEDKYEDRM